MKLIVAIVRPLVIDRLIVALEDVEDFPGVTVTDSEGFGLRVKTPGDAITPLKPNKRIEIVADEELVEPIMLTIKEHAHTNITSLRETLAKTEGVAEIHDLHVWSLTSGVNALSVHAVLANGAEHDDVLERVHNCCTMEFKISHVTAQTEREGFSCHETHL